MFDAVRQHSEVALTAMFEQYGGLVFSLAQSILADHAAADGVVLALFMRCWDGEATYDPASGTLQTWLMIETRRLAHEAQATRDTHIRPQLPPLAVNNGTPARSPRSLRDRLLARARGEGDAPAASFRSSASPSLQSLRPSASPLPPPGPVGPKVSATGPEQAARMVPPSPETSRSAPNILELEPIPSTRLPQRPRQRKIRLASLGWAGALLFVLASGLFVGAWSATGPHASPGMELRVRLPGGRILPLTSTDGTAKARLYVVDGGQRAEMTVDRLPVLPEGRVYQVWFAQSDQPFKSGGTFTVNARGDAVVNVTLPAPLSQLKGISVTAEPAGGSANPTGPQLLSWAP
ncbi:MAG: anti-sigma factor [Chloroflexota bacterium]